MESKFDAEFAKIFAAHTGLGRELAFVNSALGYLRRTGATALNAPNFGDQVKELCAAQSARGKEEAAARARASTAEADRAAKLEREKAVAAASQKATLEEIDSDEDEDASSSKRAAAPAAATATAAPSPSSSAAEVTLPDSEPKESDKPARTMAAFPLIRACPVLIFLLPQFSFFHRLICSRSRKRRCHRPLPLVANAGRVERGFRHSGQH